MTEQEKQQYASLGYKFQDVYSIFEHHFGEEYVDIWDLPSTEVYHSSAKVSIVVHFPTLIVKNEHNKFTTIQDLYVKTTVTALGKIVGQFECQRATFSYKQFMSGYVHSHLPRRSFCKWTTSCLGSGPIKRTIALLSQDSSEETWMLYCRELHEYVQVESLSGGPYIRLESIGGYNKVNYILSGLVGEATNCRSNCKIEFDCYIENAEIRSKVKNFICYLFSKKPFKFGFWKSNYHLAYSSLEFGFLLTKYFIKFLKENNYSAQPFLEQNVIESYILKPDGLYQISLEDGRITVYQDRYLFDFKGVPVHMHIENRQEDEELNVVYIMNKYIANAIVIFIHTIINYFYGKELNQGIQLI